jgi:hypothetical protein
VAAAGADQREQVHRRRNVDAHAFARLLVQPARTATRLFLLAHRHAPGVAHGRVAQQRVGVAMRALAQRQRQHDVAAAGIDRKIFAVGARQAELADARRQFADAADFYVEGCTAHG